MTAIEPPRLGVVTQVRSMTQLIAQLFANCTADGRTFWPRTVWVKHVPQLAELRLDLADTPARRATSLACLDEMIAHTLRLARSPVERAACPARRRLASCPPGATLELRPLLRTPERRLSIFSGARVAPSVARLRPFPT